MSDYQLGDAPIEAEYKQRMKELAQLLDRVFNGVVEGPDRKVGFVLLQFPYGETGRCNFISNGADRDDIIALFKEMIARFEGQSLTAGHG